MRRAHYLFATLVVLAVPARCANAAPDSGPKPKPPSGVLFSVSTTPVQAAPGERVAYTGTVYNYLFTDITMLGLSPDLPVGFTSDDTPFTTDPNWSYLASGNSYEALMFYIDIAPSVAPGDYDMWSDLIYLADIEPDTVRANFRIEVRGPAVPEAGTLAGLGSLLALGGIGMWRRSRRG